MQRTIQAEILDALPADDPRAIHSRRDIRWINFWMRNSRIMARALQTCLRSHSRSRLVELGAGDGHFLFSVARHFREDFQISATLVDQQDLLTADLRNRFQDRNWSVRSIKDDVFQWLHAPAAERADVFVTNLFLHHLTDVQLRRLFTSASERTDSFIALEPRRGRWPLFGTRLLPLIGCNSVTLHDAPASVRAGFNGCELSRLWPDNGQWKITERGAGVFSHLFIAQRISGNGRIAEPLSATPVSAAH